MAPRPSLWPGTTGGTWRSERAAPGAFSPLVIPSNVLTPSSDGEGEASCGAARMTRGLESESASFITRTPPVLHMSRAGPSLDPRFCVRPGWKPSSGACYICIREKLSTLAGHAGPEVGHLWSLLPCRRGHLAPSLLWAPAHRLTSALLYSD